MSDILVQRYPVHAEFIGGEIKSSGVAHDDYARMSTVTHKLAEGRRLAVPTWALNDDEVCVVIAHAMEARAGMRSVKKDTPVHERLLRAEKRLKETQPILVARIDRLCSRYMELKKQIDGSAAAVMGSLVEGVDTQLRLLDHMPQTYLGVIHFYWRCGYNSVATAAQLGMKPPHVRQILSKLVEYAVQNGLAAPEAITRHCYTLTEEERLQRALDKKIGRVAARVERTAERLRLLKEERDTKAAAAAERTARIIELHKAGKFTVDIARELALGKDGSAIVNNVLIQAGLR